MMENYKVEGNMIFKGDKMLTWGPFYFHSKEEAKKRMEIVYGDMLDWVKIQDPNIEPTNITYTRSRDTKVFNIKCKYDFKRKVENTNCIITVNEIWFEDEEII